MVTGENVSIRQVLLKNNKLKIFLDTYRGSCIMVYMMKKQTKPTRAHYILFCENTPFKPKRVISKLKRKPKHKLKELYGN